MMRGRLGRRTQQKYGLPFLAAGIVLCFFVVGALLRPVGREAGRSIGQWLGGRRMEQCAARTAAAIWRQWYPARGGGLSYGGASEGNLSDGAPGAPGENPAGASGWLVNFLLKQVPYYRYLRKNEPRRLSYEPDPAYGSYLESHEVLEEYEYLVRGLSESAVLTSGNNPLAGSGGFSGNDGGKRFADASGQGGFSSFAGGSGSYDPSAVGASGGGGLKGAGASGVLEDAGATGGGVLEGAGASGGGVLRGAGAAGSDVLKGAGRPVTGTGYIAEQLADYDFLMKHFYTLHPTTAAGRDMVNAETFLSEDLSLPPGNGEPQILIYHTHSQEEFADYYEGNKEATIVGVGTYLTELLEARGYTVIHDTSVYDLKDGKLDRSKAYTYALDGITGILQRYPSIQVMLDVHRDGVKEGTHLVQEVNGKPTATVMFFNGTSQTPSGPIEYLKNPYRTDNMAFSFQMKLCADAYYPGFTRRIYLKGLRYNMHLRPRSALIEVGAQTNTYEEARNAMEPLSELLDMVLRGE